ncbi:MAG: exodeoxyribonuclease III [Mariprofundaceae bacterium]|nr:exodeoxyribonuclease III [Mariprofundaceae bacterium]
MKIVSWNVNSLNVRLPQVLELLVHQDVDVLALQETKTSDASFPVAAIEEMGYHVVYAGQKSYNGVAIIARQPMNDGVVDIPQFDDDQRRVLAVTLGDLRIINLYIPNGQSLDSDKYQYKRAWLKACGDWLRIQYASYPKLVVLGDFNIAPQDEDMHDPLRWRGKIMCSPTEQAWFSDLLTMGMRDSVRELAGDQPIFTWWDYRLNAYRRRWGLRIDHVLTSHALAPRSYGIETHCREHERPSDHAPVWITLQ